MQQPVRQRGLRRSRDDVDGANSAELTAVVLPDQAPGVTAAPAWVPLLADAENAVTDAGVPRYDHP